MRIAVSGASGLIGAAVVRRLTSVHEVVAMGRQKDFPLQCDFSVLATVQEIPLSGIDAVVHCAGIVDEDFKEDPARAFHQATSGMAALVRRARECGVGRFAYISSAHVYGPLQDAIDERNAANPLSDYAIAHFASEQILRRNTGSEFRGSVFRPCAVFGIPPNLREFDRWSLIPFEFPKSVVMDRRISLKSSGEQYRNFVGTEDIAQYVSRWLDLEPSYFRVINPIGAQSMSVWAFAQLCAKAGKDLVSSPISIARVEGRPPPRLDYGTIYPEWLGSQDLFETVRLLMKRLLNDQG